MKYINLFNTFESNNIKAKTSSLQKLKQLLNDHSIPIGEWGKENAKDIESLYYEIKDEDCILDDSNGYLIRLIEFVGIIIYYTDDNGNKYLLKEYKQVFNDGRIRRRNMQSSVSEKMRFGEDPIISSIRGISEELGFIINKDQLTKRRDLNYDGGSMSYPGLKTRYKGHQYICNLTSEQFNINGYIEVQKEKSTHFKWVKI